MLRVAVESGTVFILLGQIPVRRKFRQVIRPTYRYCFPLEGPPTVQKVKALDRARDGLRRTLAYRGWRWDSALDSAGESLRQKLESRGWRFGCVDTHSRQWRLGTHTKLGVRWETFDTQELAMTRYRKSWLSKVLFDLSGVPAKCNSGLFDGKGQGVAAVLAAHQGDTRFAKGKSALAAIQAGEIPFVPPDRFPFTPIALQLIWGLIGHRTVVSWWNWGLSWWNWRSLCYVDDRQSPGVRGSVALTIDDAPGRLGRDNWMIQEVGDMLHKHGATATFMVMGSFVQGHEKELVALLRDGHELGNHGLVDRKYHKDSPDTFGHAVDECNSKILSLQRSAGVEEEVRWFRAPHGKYSQTMAVALHERGLTNVMCDTYACCPVIQDGAFIGRFLAQRVSHGSIVVIHMPEHGFREWCLQGLRLFLEGLDERGFEAVTVGELIRRANECQGDAQDDVSSDEFACREIGDVRPLAAA